MALFYAYNENENLSLLKKDSANLVEPYNVSVVKEVGKKKKLSKKITSTFSRFFRSRI